MRRPANSACLAGFLPDGKRGQVKVRPLVVGSSAGVEGGNRHDPEADRAKSGVAGRVRFGQDACAGRGTGAPESRRPQEVCIDEAPSMRLITNKGLTPEPPQEAV